jgi:hypothetical protein
MKTKIKLVALTLTTLFAGVAQAYEGQGYLPANAIDCRSSQTMDIGYSFRVEQVAPGDFEGILAYIDYFGGRDVQIGKVNVDVVRQGREIKKIVVKYDNLRLPEGECRACGGQMVKDLVLTIDVDDRWQFPGQLNFNFNGRELAEIYRRQACVVDLGQLVR